MGKELQIRYQPKDINHVKDLVMMVTGVKKASAHTHYVETYYNAPNGCLKLVVQGKEKAGDLIFEGKDDKGTPATTKLHLDDPKPTTDMITKACGIRGVLDFSQNIYKGKEVTVQVEKVVGLGEFVVVVIQLKDGQTDDEGNELMKDVVQRLDLQDSPTIGGSYVDLVLKK